MRVTDSKKQRLRVWLHLSGNVLIVVALMGLVFTLAPFLWNYFGFSTPPATAFEGYDFSLSIPSINAKAKVIPQVDPFDEAEYQAALKDGVAHAAGTALPGESGSIYLFAHSSGNMLEQIGINAAFLRLGQLQPGDEITINYEGKKYRYRVREKEIVEPYRVEFLTQTSQDQLILQTCTPLGTDWLRLLVYADPVK